MKKIGIIGGPGVGKTTLSAGIFYQLKTAGYNVELAPELIKYKVYQGADFSKPGFDILNTLEQMKLEEAIEQSDKHGHSLEFLICEAPLCNGYFYASFYNKINECQVLKQIAVEKIKTYDLLIFVRKMRHQKYVQIGRKESASEAEKLEEHIRQELKAINCSVLIIETDHQQPLGVITQEILNLK